MLDCKYPECDEDAGARGLCQKHYAMAYDLVLRAKTTWAELEAKGKSLPTQKRSSNRWFLEEESTSA